MLFQTPDPDQKLLLARMAFADASQSASKISRLSAFLGNLPHLGQQRGGGAIALGAGCLDLPPDGLAAADQRVPACPPVFPGLLLRQAAPFRCLPHLGFLAMPGSGSSSSGLIPSASTGELRAVGRDERESSHRAGRFGQPEPTPCPLSPNSRMPLGWD